MSICPCCIGTAKNNSYKNCCQPFHLQQAQPETAEALMRSRYSAFHLGLGQYIFDTHHKDSRANATVEDYTQSAVSTRWCRLEVVAANQQKNTATVEFKAFYLEKDKLHALHEVSNFVRQGNAWFYTDGAYQPKKVVKVSRNDLCPCASGLKAKKCCLK